MAVIKRCKFTILSKSSYMTSISLLSYVKYGKINYWQWHCILNSFLILNIIIMPSRFFIILQTIYITVYDVELAYIKSYVQNCIRHSKI